MFAFDYRHWGGSGGEPRQLLDPRRQLQDWHAALAHVRGLPQVDSERVGIWGSSFGGAHVIHVAAQDHAIRAVVAQVPAADTARAMSGFKLGYMLKVTGLALADRVRGLLGMAPVYFPLVGRPGDTAALGTAECWDGYMSLVPEGAPWKNQLTARSLLLLPKYRAVAVGHQVVAPTLLQAGVKDSLVGVEDVRTLARNIPICEIREYDCNHFQPYYSPMFEIFVADQGGLFGGTSGPGLKVSRGIFYCLYGRPVSMSTQVVCGCVHSDPGFFC